MVGTHIGTFNWHVFMLFFFLVAHWGGWFLASSCQDDFRHGFPSIFASWLDWLRSMERLQLMLHGYIIYNYNYIYILLLYVLLVDLTCFDGFWRNFRFLLIGARCSDLSKMIEISSLVFFFHVHIWDNRYIIAILCYNDHIYIYYNYGKLW